MNPLNRRQRIALVLALTWLSIVAVYVGRDFPTERDVYNKVAQSRSSAGVNAISVREEALRRCDTESSRDPLKEIISGCRRSVLDEYNQSSQWIERAAAEMSQIELEGLTKKQLARFLTLLFVGAMPPILIYIAFAWIARAPT